ncbi:hypothetical protein FQA39_LY18959 [Lamprigera yunnana]|nr:hypothetical protein FQA39_LY18959 [Lamprigera yunnana]
MEMAPIKHTHQKIDNPSLFEDQEKLPALAKNVDDIIFVNELVLQKELFVLQLHYYKEDRNPLNIGGPIANTYAYVLDQQMRLVPVGCCRRIVTLIRKKEERTGAVLYKTRRFSSWLPTGELEYAEETLPGEKCVAIVSNLGEIENTLLGYSEIRRLPY